MRVYRVIKQAMIYVIMLIILLCLFGCQRLSANTDGKVIFLWQGDYYNKSKLVLTTAEGGNPRMLGFYRDYASFSPDGNRVATVCDPDAGTSISEMCIINLGMYYSEQTKMPVKVSDARTWLDKKIQLPGDCSYELGDEDPFQGITSIDWSPDSSRLLLACRSRKQNHVCILDLNGNATCWDKSISKDIYLALWSPTDESVILTSTWNTSNPVINQVDETGKVINKIADGSSPAWSPDGKKIAYIEDIEKEADSGRLQGIAVTDLSGDHSWVYQPEVSVGQYYILLDGYDGFRPERLAWSPDGKSIIFSGHYTGPFSSLFKLDLKTGEVENFVDKGIFTYSQYSPDWVK